MPNGFFNGQVRSPLGMSKALDTAQRGAGKTAAMKEKAGFNTGAPGKTQSKDRSAGVKRIKAYPSSDGL